MAHTDTNTLHGGQVMLQEYWYILLLLTVVSMLFSRCQGFSCLKCSMILGLSLAVFFSASLLTVKGLISLQSAMLICGMVAIFLPVMFNTVEWKSKDNY